VANRNDAVTGGVERERERERRRGGIPVERRSYTSVST